MGSNPLVQSLAEKALGELKKNPNFPTTGFIAGGSLANLIWEYVSGNKAVINDIDVFIFNELIEYKGGEKLDYFKTDINYHESYAGLGISTKIGEFYRIDSTTNDGIYNFINYSSANNSPQIILNSFDINCTQIGYSIDNDRFYWTDHFEEFIKLGELKLVNLLSPAHSAVRLVKKKDELKAKLDVLEIQLCQFCLSRRMNDVNRTFFSDKYASKYEQYKNELDLYFTITKDEHTTKMVSEKRGIEVNMYRLEPLNDTGDITFMTSFVNKDLKELVDSNPEISGIWNSQDLIFYFRKIRNNKSYEMIWKKLPYLFENDDYVDGNFDKEDIEFIHTLTQVAPDTINKLKGFRLSEQIKLVKSLFEKYKEDPIVAISLLEKYRLNPNQEFDENDLLLMELSVRKEIKLDSRNKVERIFKTNVEDSTIQIGYF